MAAKRASVRHGQTSRQKAGEGAAILGDNRETVVKQAFILTRVFSSTRINSNGLGISNRLRES